MEHRAIAGVKSRFQELQWWQLGGGYRRRPVRAASGALRKAARSHVTGVILGRSHSVPGVRRDAASQAQQSRDDLSRLAVLAILDLPESPVDDAPCNILQWHDDAGQRGVQQVAIDTALEADDRDVTADEQIQLRRRAVYGDRDVVIAGEHRVGLCR